MPSNLFQQSRLFSSGMFRQSQIMPNAFIPYTLKYQHDMSKMIYTIDTIQSIICIVITLRFHHEGIIKDILSLMKEHGLYDKCFKIYLRFEEEPNRRVVNLCKLNYSKVEIHSSSNYNVIEFINSRFKELDTYILCYDLTTIRKDSLQSLFMKHTIQQWKYCVQMLLNYRNVRSIGLFPTTSTNDTRYYWFNTFWIRTDAKKGFETLDITERMPLLNCSKTEWFKSTAEIETAHFTVIEDDVREDINHKRNDDLNRVGYYTQNQVQVQVQPLKSIQSLN